MVAGVRRWESEPLLVRKTSHHPRLIHKVEKEEKDDSDDKQFSVHEFCLSDRADVILPCLPQLASTEHLEIL